LTIRCDSQGTITILVFDWCRRPELNAIVPDLKWVSVFFRRKPCCEQEDYSP